MKKIVEFLTAYRRLCALKRYAEEQAAAMDGTEAKRWSDSRPPTGDDWDWLYNTVRGT